MWVKVGEERLVGAASSGAGAECLDWGWRQHVLYAPCPKPELKLHEEGKLWGEEVSGATGVRGSWDGGHVRGGRYQGRGRNQGEQVLGELAGGVKGGERAGGRKASGGRQVAGDIDTKGIGMELLDTRRASGEGSGAKGGCQATWIPSPHPFTTCPAAAACPTAVVGRGRGEKYVFKTIL